MDFDSKQFSLESGCEPVSIVEVGVNHNGDMVLARKLIDEAQKAGASIVKFQAFIAEEEISKFADKADYQKETTGEAGGQLEMAKKLELSHDQLREIYGYCREKNMPFLCSAFDHTSLRFLLEDLKVKTVKVASSEVTNHPFLADIARSGVGIILSTGASTLDEVAGAVKAIKAAGDSELLLLHCVSNYPADLAQLNLRAMQTMREAFNVPVGYSDHSIGVEAPMVAVVLGAVAVEKHFTLDRNMEGPDHRASIEPAELKAMIDGMNLAHNMLGDGVKQPAPCEAANRPLIRKSIVALADFSAGHVIAREDIGFKRPLGGIEPFDMEKVLGKTLAEDVKEDEPLKWEHIA